MTPRHSRKIYRLLSSFSMYAPKPEQAAHIETDETPFDKLVQEFATRNNVSVADIKGSVRTKPLVLVRQACIYEAHIRFPAMAYNDMARRFHRDHTAVMASIGAHTMRNNIDHPLADWWRVKSTKNRDRYIAVGA